MWDIISILNSQDSMNLGMLSVLLLGFLVGLQHAVEADHRAAVASLATRSRSLMATIRQDAVWGLGTR